MPTAIRPIARRCILRMLEVLVALTCVPALSSCRSVVDSGITYRECDRSAVSESFDPGTTFEDLVEKCWSKGNDQDNVVIDDGDLILRVTEPGEFAQQWSGDGQGPLVSQRFEGNFAMAARLEVLSKNDGSLCLPSGNEVGLVVRQTKPELAWTTLLISPYEVEEPCEPGDEPQFPIRAKLTSLGDSGWGPDTAEQGTETNGIAFLEGETDLAVCRIGGTTFYFYRDPMSSVEAPLWLPIGKPIVTNTEPLDVGPTASGGDVFAVEGHFTWVGYSDREEVGDGCRGLLELLQLPEID